MNFEFKKKYGQNFLNNEYIIDQIVNSISPNSNDLIIEIGPGAGAITSKLKKYNANLIAFEIDTDTQKYLNKLEDKKTKIVYGDFLEICVKKEIENYKCKNIFILGNLPYYITTPIIDKIIKEDLNEKSLTIMVQKEVGDRFLAKTHSKEYGYMTVLLNYSYNIEKICDVSKKYFTPVPKVDSTVLKLTRKKSEKIDYNRFKQVLKEAFTFKRKTILNNLRHYDNEKLKKILERHNYTLQNRAEDLDFETFIDLSKNL